MQLVITGKSRKPLLMGHWTHFGDAYINESSLVHRCEASKEIMIVFAEEQLSMCLLDAIMSSLVEYVY